MKCKDGEERESVVVVVVVVLSRGRLFILSGKCLYKVDVIFIMYRTEREKKNRKGKEDEKENEIRNNEGK